jgi:hypothetical protein
MAPGQQPSAIKESSASMTDAQTFGPPFNVSDLEFWVKLVFTPKGESLDMKVECSEPMVPELWHEYIEFFYSGDLKRYFQEGEYQFKLDGNMMIPVVSDGVSVNRSMLKFFGDQLRGERKYLDRFMRAFPTEEQVISFTKQALEFVIIDNIKRSAWFRGAVPDCDVSFVLLSVPSPDMEIKGAPQLAVFDNEGAVAFRLTVVREEDGSAAIAMIAITNLRSLPKIAEKQHDQIVVSIGIVTQDVINQVTQEVNRAMQIMERRLKNLPVMFGQTD